MGPLKRKTAKEKEAVKAEKEARKAERRAWRDAAKGDRQSMKDDERAQRLEKIRATLQADETFEAEFRTAEGLMKKDLIFTSKRLIVAPVHGEDTESIPYRAITGFGT